MKIDNLIREGYDLLNETTDWPTYDNSGGLDRSKFVTSSEIWNCSRRIKYDKLYPSDAFPTWGWAERGNVLERWAIEQVSAALRVHHRSYTLLSAGDRQVSFYDQTQSGTPDAILRYPDYTVDVWEIKSIDPRTARRNLPKDQHIWQLQQNMDLVGHCLDTKVRTGRLIYIDASNLQDRLELDVPPNWELMDKLHAKADRIMSKENPEDLVTEGIVRGECKLCRHKERCSASIKAEKAERQLYAQSERISNGLFK